MANTKSGLKRTLPVGFYPFGASRAGIMDMAGNLWDWCEDRECTDYMISVRVLRGGSWNADQDYARSAYRGGDRPSDRSSDVGFRVVCSSPSSGH